MRRTRTVPVQTTVTLATFFACAAMVVLTMLSFPALASAEDETLDYGISMTPRKGKLLREVPRAVDWEIHAVVTAPWPDSPTILPIKQILARFPAEMSFNPPGSMPVCPDSVLGPGVNPGVPVDQVVARCPAAVIGNGIAGIYLARVNAPSGPGLTDPEMVMFNGGRDSRGRPVIKTYGYSKGVGAGLYMVGTLERNGEYRVSVPALPFDSAVGSFTMSIPGSSHPDTGRRGKAPGYVKATCAGHTWRASAAFTLGTRDTAGRPLGEDHVVVGPDLAIPCQGASGKPRLGRIRVSGPNKVRIGRKAAFRLTVPNMGTASARGLRVRATGPGMRGRAGVPRIAPGAVGTVRVRVSTAKRGNHRVRFKIGSGTAQKHAVARIRVR